MRIYVIFLVLLATFFNAGNLSAQEVQQEEIYSHSTMRHWKGIDVTTVLGNNEYATQGKRFFLYNVGTGRFVIDGGNWGMEARLFHDDFGRPLQLMKDGFINTGITEQTNSQKCVLGCNVPGVSKKNAKWTDYKKYSFTILMDVYKPDLAAWTFQRVEDESNTDTYTYYMWERMPANNPKNYYLGAAYGEWHVPEYKGDGYFIHLDDDRSCWTTADVIGNQNKYVVGGDEITVDELYQWRLISEEEFIRVLNEEIVGVNPSVSSLVPDRDFSRNSDKFDTNWVVEDASGYDYASSTGRYGYTYGVYRGKDTPQNKYNEEGWDKPVRVKSMFGDPKGDLEYGMKNSKYGFLTFEGVGRTFTSFEVPKPGWYEVQCYGFVQSASDHDAFLFARVAGSNSTDPYGGESKINLVTVPPGTYSDKNLEEECLAVGKELTLNGPSYLSTVWICITEEQFNSGMRTMELGVGKDLATQSEESFMHGGNAYYFDTDWVCVDDFRATYMGESPVFFYEDEENLNYLAFDENNIQHNQSSTPYNRYSGAACLERTFKKGQWNSFAFPLPLTGEQMRIAFGEDAQLARIHSIGNLSKNSNVIDFKSVSLRTTENVVEPGQFYLLKPTADPILGKDPRGIETTFYQLGRMFFSVNPDDQDNEDYQFPVLSLDKLMDDSQQIESFEGENDGSASVNYVRTPGYNSFSVNVDGLYLGGSDNSIYAPNGSYVVSRNTIYHINKDTPLKGFRGWINLEHAIPPTSEAKMSLYGMFYKEDEPTGIGSLTEPQRQQAHDDSIYDLSGRKIGKLGMNLSKGLYIVNGKKYLVK